MKEIEKKKDQYSDATLEVTGCFLYDGSAGTNMTIDVIGEDLAHLEKVANTIKDKVADIDGVEK